MERKEEKEHTNYSLLGPHTYCLSNSCSPPNFTLECHRMKATRSTDGASLTHACRPAFLSSARHQVFSEFVGNLSGFLQKSGRVLGFRSQSSTYLSMNLLGCGRIRSASIAFIVSEVYGDLHRQKIR